MVSLRHRKFDGTRCSRWRLNARRASAGRITPTNRDVVFVIAIALLATATARAVDAYDNPSQLPGTGRNSRLMLAMDAVLHF